MNEQNYGNHRRLSKGYHFFLFSLLIAGLGGSFVNLYHSNGATHYSAALICLLFVCLILAAFYARVFAIKAQDRAIRAEETLRYFALAGKLPAASLTVGQFAALRFAPNEEFVPLLDKTVSENLPPAEIKKMIQKWRADHHRV